MASRIVPEGGHRLKPFKTPRVKNRGHLDFIKRLPCVACISPASSGSHVPMLLCRDPAHLRSGSRRHGKEPAGAGEKPDDRWSLPLCRFHHDDQHAMNELEFWARFGVDPFLLALVLWGLTGDEHGAVEALRAHLGG